MLPALVLAVVWAAGLGPAAILGRRFPPAAQIALAAPLSAGALACASPLIYLGVPAKAICAVTLGGLGLITIGSAKRIPRSLAGYAAPVAVAVLALALASIPSLHEGDWGVRTFSNVDPYVWVSQARSLLDGAPDAGAGVHPDAIAYERINDEHWPTGLPVTLAGAAWLTSSDPVDVYGAFAALWSALLALAVFFCARAALVWSSALSLAAGALVGANGYLLFGMFFGWQAQTALATFGVLSLFCFRLALDAKAHSRERWLAGALAVAGVATYGWPYVVFAGLTAAAFAGYLVTHGVHEWRRATRVVAGFGLAVGLIGALPLVQLARSLGVQTRDRSAEILNAWATYDRAWPPDALGFVPRTSALQEGRPDWELVAAAVVLVVAVAFVVGGLARMSFLKTKRGAAVTVTVLLLAEVAIFRARYVAASEWALVGFLVATGVLAAGLVSTRSFRNPRGDVLAAALFFFVAGLLYFWAFGSTPLYSIRLMGYAAPFFTLVALATLAPRWQPSRGWAAGRAFLLAAGLGLFLVGTVTAARQGRAALRTTDQLEQIAAATVLAVDPDAVIEIDVAETWDQAWLVYYLRDREVSLVQPSLYFTGLTGGAMRELPRRADVEYSIQPRPGRRVVAETPDFFLNRLEPRLRR